MPLSSIINYVMVAIEITALSLAYRELMQQGQPGGDGPGRNTQSDSQSSGL